MIALTIAALLATPEFPAVIQSQLDLGQRPRCTICHATEAGGTGTVVKPFGIYLKSRGLVPGDDDSLRNALLADAGERHSSSGDGITDIDALKAGEDPNGNGPGTDLIPAQGCSSGSSPGWVTTLAAAGWLLLRRRRRRP
jgi:MYXO-CTERM domain-containing protein